jgi:hypothetical protein
MRVSRNARQVSSHTLFATTERATWEITSYLGAQSLVIIGATNWAICCHYFCLGDKKVFDFYFFLIFS